MSYAFSSPLAASVLPAAILIDSARCWREARDAGRSVQPCLTAVLRQHACEMLAPVFASLMELCEAALDRRLAIGTPAALSDDEQLLLGLLDGSKPRHACIRCPHGAASALDCAICSTRIMMKLALTDGPRRRAIGRVFEAA